MKAKWSNQNLEQWEHGAMLDMLKKMMESISMDQRGEY